MIYPYNQKITERIGDLIKVGLAVVDDSYEYAIMSVEFREADILIHIEADGIEMTELYLSMAKGIPEEYIMGEIPGKMFTCSVREYRQFRRQIVSDGEEIQGIQDLTIKISQGQNKKYYKGVKKILKQMYSKEQIEKITFCDPIFKRCGKIQYIHKGK